MTKLLGQRTGGLVAGIVIPILLVLTLLVVAGVVIAVVWYRYKPHQKVLKSKQRGTASCYPT